MRNKLIGTIIILSSLLFLVPAYAGVRIEFVPEIGAIWIAVQNTNNSNDLSDDLLSDNILIDDKKRIVVSVKPIKKIFTFEGKKVEIIVYPEPGNYNIDWDCGAHVGAYLDIIVNDIKKIDNLMLIPQDCFGSTIDDPVVVIYEIDEDLVTLSPFITPSRADSFIRPLRIEYDPEIGEIWIRVVKIYDSARYPVTDKIKKILQEKYNIIYLEDYIKTDEKGMIVSIKPIKKHYTFKKRKIDIVVNIMPGNNNTRWDCGEHIGASVSIIIDKINKVKDLTLMSKDCRDVNNDKPIMVIYDVENDWLTLSPTKESEEEIEPPKRDEAAEKRLLKSVLQKYRNKGMFPAYGSKITDEDVDKFSIELEEHLNNPAYK